MLWVLDIEFELSVLKSTVSSGSVEELAELFTLKELNEIINASLQVSNVTNSGGGVISKAGVDWLDKLIDARCLKLGVENEVRLQRNKNTHN